MTDDSIIPELEEEHEADCRCDDCRNRAIELAELAHDSFKETHD